MTLRWYGGFANQLPILSTTRSHTCGFKAIIGIDFRCNNDVNYRNVMMFCWCHRSGVLVREEMWRERKKSSSRVATLESTPSNNETWFCVYYFVSVPMTSANGCGSNWCENNVMHFNWYVTQCVWMGWNPSGRQCMTLLPREVTCSGDVYGAAEVFYPLIKNYDAKWKWEFNSHFGSGIRYENN